MSTKWIKLADLSVSRLPDLGAGSGAYAFRDRATNELLYAGSTKCLRQRLFGNYLGGVGGATTKRINGLLFEADRIGNVEVAVYPSDDFRQLEAHLKREHGATHDGRLPVWTRR